MSWEIEGERLVENPWDTTMARQLLSSWLPEWPTVSNDQQVSLFAIYVTTTGNKPLVVIVVVVVVVVVAVLIQFSVSCPDFSLKMQDQVAWLNPN